jgi:hypothetical protein
MRRLRFVLTKKKRGQMLRYLKKLVSRKPFVPLTFSGLKVVYAPEKGFTGFLGESFTYFSEHHLGLIRTKDRLKINADDTNPIEIQIKNGLVITPHTFFDTEDYLKRLLEMDYSFNTPEHFKDLHHVLTQEGYDAVIIDGFRKLPQSFFNRTFSNRRTATGIFSWDCILIPTKIAIKGK